MHLNVLKQLLKRVTSFDKYDRGFINIFHLDRRQNSFTTAINRWREMEREGKRTYKRKALK